MTAATSLALLVSALAPTAPSTAQEAPDTLSLAAALAGHVYRLDVAPDGIEGPGARWLMEQGAGAEFFMVGERHAIREVPWLVGGLLEGLIPHGYSVLAVEVGPAEARRFERLAAEAEGEEAFVQAATRLGWTVPFYSWEEEAELLYRALTAPGRIRLWGFDQEFVYGGARTVATLPAAPGRGAALDEFRARARAADSTALAGMDSRSSFLMTSDPAEFERLRSVVADDPAARWAVDQLAESSAIYRLFVNRQIWESNDRRERLMRANMQSYFDSAAARGHPAPKVLAKGGAFHFYRGMRPQTWTWTLGNFLQEVAFARGGESFNVRIFAGPRSTGFENLQAEWSGGGAARLVSLAEGMGSVVVDLRPLRPLVAAGRIDVEDRFRTLIWGYDAAVFVAGAHLVVH